MTPKVGEELLENDRCVTLFFCPVTAWISPVDALLTWREPPAAHHRLPTLGLALLLTDSFWPLIPQGLLRQAVVRLESNPPQKRLKPLCSCFFPSHFFHFKNIYL